MLANISTNTLTLIELARTCWAILSNICKVVCRNGPTAPVHLRHCIPGLQEQHPSHLGHLQYKRSKRTLSSSTGFSSKCWCTLQKVCFLEAAKGTLADSEIDTSVALIPAVNYASRILGQNSLFSLIIKSKEQVFQKETRNIPKPKTWESKKNMCFG